MAGNNRTMALLIDGDNAEASLLPQILSAVEERGNAIIRRIYGDWTEPELKGWKKYLNTYSIQPVQQFRYTTGKNATDSALIIDAMDIMYQSDVTGFCIVSSDSDYTRLATRIQENNLFVMGIGRKSTVPAFVNACSEFVFTETLHSNGASHLPKPSRPPLSKREKELLRLVWEAYRQCARDNGWADLSALGTALRKIKPGFTPKDYGHAQLSKLVREYPLYIEVRNAGSRQNPIYHIRVRP